jgi:hypothetical protein
VPEYTILRDLSRQNMAGPFEAAIADRETPAASSMRVDVEALELRDVRTIARDPQVRAIAPVMPIALVKPVTAEEAAPAAAGGTTWGVSAVVFAMLGLPSPEKTTFGSWPSSAISAWRPCLNGPY